MSKAKKRIKTKKGISKKASKSRYSSYTFLLTERERIDIAELLGAGYNALIFKRNLCDMSRITQTLFRVLSGL